MPYPKKKMKAKAKTTGATKVAKKAVTKKAVTKKAKQPAVPRAKVSKKPAKKGSGDRLVQLFQEKQKLNCGKDCQENESIRLEIGTKLWAIANELGVKLPLNKDGSFSKAKTALSALNKTRAAMGLKESKVLDMMTCKATVTRGIEVARDKLPEAEQQQVAVAADKQLYGEVSAEALKTAILVLTEEKKITLPVEFDDELLASMQARVDFIVEELAEKKIESMVEAMFKKLSK